MREWGKIMARIHRSEKFRRLNDAAQMVYVYLHTCSHGNSAGCFHISPVMVAAERNRPLDAITDSLNEVAEVGLIRRFEAEDLVQIVGFFEFNCPSSRPQLAGPLRILDALPECDAVAHAKAELAVAIHQKALGFDGHEAQGAFFDHANKLLSAATKRVKIDVSADLASALQRDLLIDLSGALSSLTETEIQTNIQTQTQKTTQTITQTETETLQADIDALNQKARKK